MNPWIGGRGAAPRVLALAVALGVAAIGCAHQRTAARARTYPAPDVAELEARLAVRQAAIGSMNARVRATSWLGGERVRATVLMLVERAGKLRFEAEVSLQGTVAVLATDGARFGFLDVGHGELRRGPACPRNVAALIRIPLAPAEVAALLLGDVRLPDERMTDPTRLPHVEWDGELGGDVLVLPRLDGWLRVVFAAPSASGGAAVGGGAASPPAIAILAVIATGPDGSPRWRARFEDFVASDLAPAAAAAAEAGSGPMVLPVPRLIRYAEGSASFDDGVEIKFKERVFNATSPTDAFSIVPTSGVRIVEVGCP